MSSNEPVKNVCEVIYEMFHNRSLYILSTIVVMLAGVSSSLSHVADAPQKYCLCKVEIN